MIKKNLAKPIFDMSRETLNLASFATKLKEDDDDLIKYLESCRVLAFKTPEKKEATGASNTAPSDPSESAKKEEVKSEEAKCQEVKKHKKLLAEAVLDSVAINMDYIDREGLPAAPKYAANALIRSITPQIGIAV